MSTVNELIPKETREKIDSDIKSLLDGSKIDKINNEEQAQNAGELVKSVSSLIKEQEDLHDKLKAPFLNNGRIIDAFFKEQIAKLTPVKKNLADKINEWNRELEQKRIEAQRKADEQARKEREAIEAKAREQREKEEKARREAEEKRQAEERARREAEEKRQAAEREQDAKKREALEAEARAADEEQRKSAAEAQKLENKADTAALKAETSESIASTVVAPVVNTTPFGSKVKGVSSTTKHSGEFYDKEAFLKHCLETGKLHFVLIDEATVNKVIAIEKENFKAPGVRVVSGIISRVRAA